jgi:outer membrane protein OmpA-like peptidoglycan-associated protein
MINLKIGFRMNTIDLTEESISKLRELGEILKTRPGRILVGGHTASTGRPEAEMNLSRRRAQVVADYLVREGVRKPADIIVRGYGATRPLTDSSSPEAMQTNRRVEVILLYN